MVLREPPWAEAKPMGEVLVENSALCASAASTPPTKGATMNSHTWCRDVPPTINAGPSARAGFTEVPVIGMPIRCTTVSVRPITRPAVEGFAVDVVTPRITKTNSAVRTTSAMNAPPAPMWMWLAAPHPSVPSPVVVR